MKKLQNSLYITRQETYVHKERETLVIKQGSEKLAQYPIHAIANLFCFGQVSVSPPLMGYCGEKGVGLSFYTQYGRFLARVQGVQSGNVLLRRQQYRQADDPSASLALAQPMIAAKIANSRSILQREIRNKGPNSDLSQVIDKLADCLRRTAIVTSLESLRGIEGEAAANYFSIFNQLLTSPGFEFQGRIKRPATDPVNALLSFIYTLVTQELVSALQGVGLDPYVGFMHTDRPGRVSLALDMIEELRAWWCDRLALTLINRKELKRKDFKQAASGAMQLTETARKRVIEAYQEKKQDTLTHPYLEEKITIGLIPHCQALLLARHLRGDLAHYPPFITR